MKKTNLNETWKLCLSMWRWIAKERGRSNYLSVYTLKAKWLRKHGFKENSVREECFFCEYCSKHRTIKAETVGCPDCPGTKVDRSFDCRNTDYNFYSRPIAFYKKLLALNKIRTAKK